MARCDSAANRFQMPLVWELGRELEGRQGGSITRCDPLQSGDVLPGYSGMYEYACKKVSKCILDLILDKHTDRHNCGHTSSSCAVECTPPSSCKYPMNASFAKAWSSWFESHSSAHLLLAPQKFNIWQHSKSSSSALGL